MRESTALLAMVGLIAGITLVGQDAGSAAGPVAQSNGTFLSGSVLDSPLSDLASVTPAEATNNGGAAVVDNHPLTVSALNALDVSLGQGVNLFGGSGVLRLGAVAQYAQAAPDGSSKAASGALTDSGAIAVDGSAEFPSDATFSLAKLIGPSLAGALADVSLTTGALSASADQTASGTQTGDYRIATLTLDATSPLVSGITTGLRSTLGGLQPVVAGLPALIRALPAVGPLATITGLPTLTAIVDRLGDVTSLDGSITANLKTGAISVDVAAVLKSAGLDLNKLDPDTELLPYVTRALTTQLLPAITTALTGLAGQLTAAINGISVSVLGVPVATAVLAPVLNPVIAQLVAPVNTVVSGLGNTVISPLADALTALLSLRANVQETAGGRFTERALRVGLLPTASTPLAVLNLASATVGPNAGPAAPVVPTATGLSPDHGPVAGGQTVTVTGSGFVPDSTTVTIGGNTVPATVTGPTSLTFVTPAHAAGDVSVTVTTPAGTSTPALTYTYDPAASVAPTATVLSPDHGPTAGGQTVTVTGSGFVAGSTTVTIGGNTVPATVTSPTSLTFVTPAHAAGDVSVTVTTSGGTSTPLGYTYDPASPAAPTTSGLSPDHGPAVGGQTVTVTGSGFVPGSTSVTVGGNTVPATVTDPTTLTFVTPPHAAGDVPVTVTTLGGTSAPALTYTYDPAAAVVPTATGLTPDHGPAAGGTAVTVTGSDFVAGSTTVTIGGNTVPATVTSPTSLTFVTPAHAAGDVPVTVTTPGGTSTPALTYTYDPAAPVVPTASGLTPTHGPAAGGQTVTVTGTGFVPGSTSVTIGGNVVPATSVTVTSPTTLTFATPAHAAGDVAVTVSTLGGTSSPALTYTYDPAAAVVPTASGLSPTHGPASGGTAVTITGTGFVPGSTSVTIGGISVPAIVTSSTSLTLVTPAHVAGDVAVTVTTRGGTSTPALTYTYDPAVPVLPTASALSPGHGPAGGGQTVTVTGTGFVPGSTIVTIGGIVVPTGSVTVTSPTSLTFPTPAHVAGDVAVTVSTLGGTTSPALTYTYDPAAAVAPTASGLTPTHGPVTGGQTVSITGSGFVPGSTSVTIGGVQVPASRVTVVSPTRLLVVTPKHAAGPVRVTVTTRGGTSAPLAYTYDAVPGTLPPTITEPTDGTTTTDTTPIIRGTGTPRNRITVTEDGRTLCTAVVGDDGRWSCESGTLAAGDHRIVSTETTPDGGAVGSTRSNFAVNAETTSRNDGGLATTGLAIASTTLLALVLAGAGTLLLLAGRRRRET